MWGGRFTASTNPSLEKLNSSIEIDKRMFAEDIDGSVAYASALKSIGLLTYEECIQIHEGLHKVKLEWEQGKFAIQDGDEDIHTANERRLKVVDVLYTLINCVIPGFFRNLLENQPLNFMLEEVETIK